MSHIGNKKIIIPENIKFKKYKNLLSFEGIFGSQSIIIPDNLDICLKLNIISIIKLDDTKKTHSYQGLYRSLIQNIITGITEKFNKTLNINGTGYKFRVNDNELEINTKFNHLIKLVIPSNLNLKLETPNRLTISGINKEEVSFFASKIYQVSPPEPYKGKGISYLGQIIRRKVGKTGK